MLSWVTALNHVLVYAFGVHLAFERAWKSLRILRVLLGAHLLHLDYAGTLVVLHERLLLLHGYSRQKVGFLLCIGSYLLLLSFILQFITTFLLERTWVVMFIRT